MSYYKDSITLTKKDVNPLVVMGKNCKKIEPPASNNHIFHQSNKKGCSGNPKQPFYLKTKPVLYACTTKVKYKPV